MSEWESVKARLGQIRSIGEQDDDLRVYVNVADIRAALERVEELERGKEMYGDELDRQSARAEAAEAEVERLRAEFRRIEECVAAMLAGERCYAQVVKLLHEAPRAALARR